VTGPADPIAEAAVRQGLFWKTAVLVVSMLAVWAFGLGVLDRMRPDEAGTSFQSSPSARVEQRPALFAVTWDRSGTNVGPGTIGIATPIALVEPGGAIVSAIVARSEDAARAEARKFAATYFKPSTGLLLLRGGAVAGEVRFVGDPLLDGFVPVVPVAGTGPNDFGPLVVEATTLLAISDQRATSEQSGIRPMRDDHRKAVDTAVRQVLKDRFPSCEIVDEGLARVRVADLDRDGLAEVLASRFLKFRGESGLIENAVVFLIAEPERVPVAGETSYRIAFASMRVFAIDGPRPDIVFIDQADLTSSEVDEVVLRYDDGATSRYAVLRRDQTVWTQACSTPPVRPPSLRPLANGKADG